MKRVVAPAAALLAGLTFLAPARADEPTAAERGKAHLLGQAYNPPTITLSAYENAWKQWGLKEKPAPADYDRLFRERYGLHAAPYPNGRYPMGLREADFPFTFGQRKGLAQDCLICHGGSIAGQSYVGLGNTDLDYQAFAEEMDAADGRPRKTPFTFCNVRGTIEAGVHGRLPSRLPRAGPDAAHPAASTSNCTTTCARTRRPGGCSRRKRPCTTTAAATSGRCAR